MMKTVRALLCDNTGDENISKMIWVAIAFIVGAILLVLVSSAFQGPIKTWYETVIKSWFDEGGLNGKYPASANEQPSLASAETTVEP